MKPATEFRYGDVIRMTNNSIVAMVVSIDPIPTAVSLDRLTVIMLGGSRNWDVGSTKHFSTHRWFIEEDET